MQNSNPKFSICIICNQEITLPNFETYIKSKHESEEDKENDFGIGPTINLEDFKTDMHLKCRISTAQYSLAGLGFRWFSSDPYRETINNKLAYQEIERRKKMFYPELQINGLYLYGSPGLGKTHLLADLCRNLLGRGARDVSWNNTSSILIQLRSSFGKKYQYDEETQQEKILKKLHARYLFLDDLGTESATEWTKEIFYEAINYRYEEKLPLFISGNLSPQELAEKLGDKFVSRIIEMCKSVKITGEDGRLQRSDLENRSVEKVLPAYINQMARWSPTKIQKK